MPLYDEDGQSGSGFSPKSRLDLPSVTGDMSQPISKGEFQNFLRLLKDWSQRLELGRVGFTMRTFPLDNPGVIAADIPWTFDQTVEDSNGFARTNMNPDLTYFQVPPGMGRPYCINYYLNFALLVENTDTFNFTGAMQEWTAPTDILENTATFMCRGGAGNLSTGGGTDNGFGHQVTATFNNITPGSVWDIEVGDGNQTAQPGCWPDGGDGDSVATGSSGGGGGRSSVRPDGTALTDAYLVAGAGGGQGRSGGAFAQVGGNGGNGTALFPGQDGAGMFNCGGANATGGTDTAGGVAAGSGSEVGGNGAFGQGGDTGDSINSFAFQGGGGGGGWYGGGSGATPIGSGDYGGGGAGGSSHARSGAQNVVAQTAASKARGQVTATYYTTTPAPSTAVITKVWVAYAQYPNKNPYEEVRVVVSDEGSAPHKGAVILPLGEGDRVWMTVENGEATLGILNFTFGMYAQGQ